MTIDQKQELVKELLKVNNDTMWGAAIKNFIDSISTKQSEDYIKLVADLKQQNKDSPILMKSILGYAYDYIISYQLPTDFAPFESEGIE